MIAVELNKLIRNRRTWITIALIDALPTLVAVLLAITDIGPRPGTGPAFLSAVLTDGTLYPLAAIAIVLPLFLPAAVAVVAGDAIAGESQAGTLRYVLIRPVGRTRLLVAEQGVATASVSGTSLTTQQVLWRTALSLAYAMLSMLGVASIALFLSTVVESPLAAALGTIGVLIASTLLLTLDAATSLYPYLPTRYWLSFVDLFRDPILWRNVTRGTGLQLVYVVVLLGAGWANFTTKDIKD